MGLYKRINTNNREVTLFVTVKCNGSKKFRVFSCDATKKNSYYADRNILVDTEREIYISMPVTPKEIIIGVENVDNKDDQSFQFEIREEPLIKYDVWLDSESREFVQLAIHFSQVCGFKVPAKNGTMYSTKDGYFNIKYFPVIVDSSTGQALSTPARIGHKSGIIEVAAKKFIHYTIPMRMCILLHEFSHKYKNPKMDLDISNEIGADINALYIYLGLGFSKIDAICVFANVFLKAQTNDNIVRMRKIKEYINKFENQEFAKIN